MTDEVGDNELAFAQIGMNTSEIVGSLHLYSELFGYSNAGCGAAWGSNLRVQGLGPDTETLIWWLVSDVPFFQLEFFHHTRPKQRPLPEDWRPCDLGWVRFGIAVADFDRVVTGLERRGIALLGTSGAKPRRRLAFRDPHVGAVVEVIESAGSQLPAVTYAASSVSDLDEARRYYRDVIGADIQPIEHLHSPEDEALWGLQNAQREGFLAVLPGGPLEIVHYSDPVGRPRRSDYRTSDQGIVNVALGSRNPDVVKDAIRRVQADGREVTYVLEMGNLCATYVVEAGYEVELFSAPKELDAMLGFAKDKPFLAEAGFD